MAGGVASSVVFVARLQLTGSPYFDFLYMTLFNNQY